MPDRSTGSRVARPEVTVKLATLEHGKVALLSPSVGQWRGAPEVGAVVVPRQSLGELETLGVVTLLRAPAMAMGIVLEVHGARDGRATRPVQYGQALLVLEWTGAARGLVAMAQGRVGGRAGSGALVFRTPTSGRYYARPGPGREPFVKIGDVIEAGQTVALLEVMKTFNRLQYGGEALPERARVKRLVAVDESDLAPGDVLLELEPE
jgi:acetyl-CoA carboxylase biotin carboxyl carrier protein